MSPRDLAAESARPHYIYIHYGQDREVLYVGLTTQPEKRPNQRNGREAWIDTESKRVEVSPAMPIDAARWMERELIASLSPKHNVRPEANRPLTRDARIDRIIEVEGVAREVAAWAVAYYPTDADEFEQFLGERSQQLLRQRLIAQNVSGVA